MTPKKWQQALSTLSRQDPVLKKLIRSHGTGRLQRRRDPFVALSRAIIGQQLSVKAAQSIWLRLVDMFGADGGAHPWGAGFVSLPPQRKRASQGESSEHRDERGRTEQCGDREARNDRGERYQAVARLRFVGQQIGVCDRTGDALP